MFHQYIGDYPKNRENGWSNELQGVAHDDNNWFFTQKMALWKFPIGHDLNRKQTKADPGSGILKVGIPRTLRGYDHFGDLDLVDGYLLVPMTGKQPPILAVFRASDLSFVDSAPFEGQQYAGWCAFNQAFGLFSSNSTLGGEKKDGNNAFGYVYHMDIEKLRNGRLELMSWGTFELQDEDRNSITLNHMQGGVFSEPGLLYTVNGYIRTSTTNTGVMVWELLGGYMNHLAYKRVARSGNGSGNFNFEFHPNLPSSEEPEGITIWDLDDRHAPGISGQLHVIMLDNDRPLNDDDFYFKHYRILDERPSRDSNPEEWYDVEQEPDGKAVRK